MTGVILLLGLVLYLVCSVRSAGPQCFACSSISRPEFCGAVTYCAEGEKCYIQKTRTHNGRDQYTSGCLNNQSCSLGTDFQGVPPFGQLSCVECCDGNMCNNQGCGDTGPPARESRGPYCYHCKQQPATHMCHTLTLCDQNEACTVDQTSESHYSSGCRPKGECLNHGPIEGRDVEGRGYQSRESPEASDVNTLTRSTQPCHRCCLDDFCNQNCRAETQQGASSWGVWGPWSSCSANTCSRQGQQTRTRSCRTTGVNCDGVSMQLRNCSSGLCSSCDDIYNSGFHTSGVYTIAPVGHQPLNVVCDMSDGGGWTVLQHRQHGSVSFNRGWTDYVTGFGDLRGDFWLGLEYIHLLTTSSVHVIIDMKANHRDLIRYSYDHFQVKNANSSYQLLVANDNSVNCTSYARLMYNNGSTFSTPDRQGVHGCSSRGSGWWFNECSYFNINGVIGVNDNNYGMAAFCHPNVVQLNETVMKIK